MLGEFSAVSVLFVTQVPAELHGLLAAGAQWGTAALCTCQQQVRLWAHHKRCKPVKLQEGTLYGCWQPKQPV